MAPVSRIPPQWPMPLPAPTHPPSHVERLLDTGAGVVRCLAPATLVAGRPMALLVHGIGGRAEVWNPVLPLFQAVNAIAIDLPGHGKSPGPLLPTAPAGARCLDAVRIALGLDSVFAVGQSLGGAVVQCFACDFPASSRGIVIANSAADFSVGEERLRQIEADWPAAARDFAARQLSSAAAPALKQQAQQMVSWREPAVLVHDLGLCNAFSARAWAATIRTPVLILTGDEDPTTGVERARDLHALYPHADLCVLERCGHNAALEQPERFAAAVDAFVGKRR